jgi:lipopolysaccharide/colanic/teichoic acid biosynthesis glycosyltransferase
MNIDSIAEVRARSSNQTMQVPSENTLGGIFTLLDIIGVFLAYFLVLSWRLGAKNLPSDSDLIFLLCGAFALNWLTLFIFDLYRIEAPMPSLRTLTQTLVAVFVATCVIVLVTYISGAVEFSGVRGRGVLIGSQLFFAVWAGIYRGWVHRWIRKIVKRSRWLVLTNKESWARLESELHKYGAPGHFTVLTDEVVGFSLSSPPIGSRSTESQSQSSVPYSSLVGSTKRDIGINRSSGIETRLGGSYAQLPLMLNESWSGCLVTDARDLSQDLMSQLMTLRLCGTRIVDMVDFYEETWYKVPVMNLAQSWFALSQGFRLLHHPIGLRIKRAADIILATALFILTLPIQIISALALWIESPGPVIFRQTRVGQNNRLFTIFKLRSMHLDAEKSGPQWAKSSDDRVLTVGRILRTTRIDELPQLVNVIRGDMSFVGPRPERPEFTQMLEKEIPYYSLRHLLKPGITGWAQVLYPYGASVEDSLEKLQYDLYYIKNYSLTLDLTIVLKTIRVVLFGRGR